MQDKTYTFTITFDETTTIDEHKIIINEIAQNFKDFKCKYINEEETIVKVECVI